MKLDFIDFIIIAFGIFAIMLVLGWFITPVHAQSIEINYDDCTVISSPEVQA